MTGNVVKVEGKEFVLPNPDIAKDIFSGEYFIISKYAEEICTDLVLVKDIKTRKKFNRDNPDTWDDYDLVKTIVDCRNFSHRNPNYNKIESCAINVVIYSVNRTRSITIYVKDKEEFIKKNKLVPGIHNPDIYYNKREVKFMDKPKPYRKFDNTYSKQSVDNLLVSDINLKSDSKDLRELTQKIMKRNIQMGVDSLTHMILESKKYTFGVELETSSGRLESDDVVDLNIKAVHDGSLRDADGNTPGGEYVTGILYGDAGFHQLSEICRVLASKCSLNNKCGVHVHIGNIKWNKEDVVYSYLLAEQIEKDLFSILPKSRRNNSYCRSLTPLLLEKRDYLSNPGNNLEYAMRIDELYNIIHAEVSGTKDPEGPNASVNKNKQHPKGPKCGYDKNAQRYCWLNYVTLMFDTKGIPNSHTLEFRPMSATLNYIKVRNWIKICVAFVYFVENFKSIIKAGKYVHNNKEYVLDLELMVAKTYPKTGAKLIDYIRERRETFKVHNESVDYKDIESNKKSIKEVVCA